MANDTMVLEKTKRSKAGNGAAPDLANWMDGGIHALESWTQSSSSLMKGSFELAQEMMAFSQARLRADIDAWKVLTACRNANDLFECQKELSEKVTAQYLEEANKIASQVIGIMSGAAAVFQDRSTKT